MRKAGIKLGIALIVATCAGVMPVAARPAGKSPTCQSLMLPQLTAAACVDVVPGTPLADVYAQLGAHDPLNQTTFLVGLGGGLSSTGAGAEPFAFFFLPAGSGFLDAGLGVDRANRGSFSDTAAGGGEAAHLSPAGNPVSLNAGGSAGQFSNRSTHLLITRVRGGAGAFVGGPVPAGAGAHVSAGEANFSGHCTDFVAVGATAPAVGPVGQATSNPCVTPIPDITP